MLTHSTHWGQVAHICVGKIISIGSDNGLSPGRRQAIIWTIAGILLIRPLGINFIEILIEINIFSFMKMHLKMASAKWRLFCLGLNELWLFGSHTASLAKGDEYTVMEICTQAILQYIFISFGFGNTCRFFLFCADWLIRFNIHSSQKQVINLLPAWYTGVFVNTLRPKQNGKHFQMHFLEWKCLNFEYNLTEVCYERSN